MKEIQPKKSCSCGCGGTCKTNTMENKLRKIIQTLIKEELDMSSVDASIDSLSDAIVTLRSIAKKTKGPDREMLLDIASFLDTLQYGSVKEGKNKNKK
jgi:hypothetical protein